MTSSKPQTERKKITKRQFLGIDPLDDGSYLELKLTPEQVANVGKLMGLSPAERANLIDRSKRR